MGSFESDRRTLKSVHAQELLLLSIDIRLSTITREKSDHKSVKWTNPLRSAKTLFVWTHTCNNVLKGRPLECSFCHIIRPPLSITCPRLCSKKVICNLKGSEIESHQKQWEDKQVFSYVLGCLHHSVCRITAPIKYTFNRTNHRLKCEWHEECVLVRVKWAIPAVLARAMNVCVCACVQ